MNSSSPQFSPSIAKNSKWLIPFSPTQRDLPPLFCFASAGGSAELFRQWQASLADDLTICPIELPGRGRRSNELFCKSLREAALASAHAITANHTSPYFLFGHSLGSVIALETARTLQRMKCPPLGIFLSGRVPPHVVTRGKLLHTLADSKLITELRRLGGTQEDLLSSPQFMEFLLPIIRDDYRLLETYEPRLLPKLTCPIHVCCGDTDKDAPWGLLNAWGDLTDALCEVTLFKGGHFYINTDRQALVDYIRKTCSKYL